MGPTIIFLEAGDENFFKTNNFFSVLLSSLSVKTFFSGVVFLQIIFFMPAKKLVGLYFAKTNFSGSPPPPLPLNLYDLSFYGLQRTSLLT